eukprot:gnl/TRDRNA2_/TRDRNA2_167362_c1_seq2.p2 gnl/TRDRNA2_/TRDRNA2_167362_c1~~gnl/TRDRNA2_/TRDRNA2_167362_c1_seq2.p2  ORF type:complete len:123 (+),score=10.67 gnl/TRDRNA2_/TRDRNA2_167362_c1_seq2:40-369(+)
MKGVLDCNLLSLESASFREVLKRYPGLLSVPTKHYAHAFLESLRNDVAGDDLCGDLQSSLLSSPNIAEVFGEEGGCEHGLQSFGIQALADPQNWRGYFRKAARKIRMLQ